MGVFLTSVSALTTIYNTQDNTWLYSVAIGAGGASNNENTSVNAWSLSLPAGYSVGWLINFNESARITCKKISGIGEPTNCQHWSWLSLINNASASETSNSSLIGNTLGSIPPYTNVNTSYNKSLGLYQFNQSNCSTFALGTCAAYTIITSNNSCALGSPCIINTTIMTRNYTWLLLDNPPAFQTQYFTKINGSQYNYMENISFFANFTEDTAISNVILSLDAINWTAYLWNGSYQNGYWRVDATWLNASLHKYYWWANDTLNVGNQSPNFNLNISKNTTWTLNQTLNNSYDNLTGIYPWSARDRCYWHSSFLEVGLWLNGTVIVLPAAGGGIDVTINGRSAGSWNFTCGSPGDENFTALFNTTWAFIQKFPLTSNLYLNGTAANKNYIYGETVNASGYRQSFIDDNLNLTLIRDGLTVTFGITEVNETNQTRFTPATLNYTLHFNQTNQNYTGDDITWYAFFANATPTPTPTPTSIPGNETNICLAVYKLGLKCDNIWIKICIPYTDTCLVINKFWEDKYCKRVII